MHLIKFTILALTALSVSGCASFNTIRSDRHITVGQEMLDLQKAKEAGIITESQYNEQIASLLKVYKGEININAKISGDK